MVRSTLGARVDPQRVAWLVPVALFAGIVIDVNALSAIVATATAVGYLLVVRRRPATAVSVLLVLILFNPVMLPLLFKVGGSASLVKAASFWKEGIVVGALLALVGRGPRRRLDALDVVAVAFLVLSTIYLLAPAVVGAAASSFSLHSRALGWRSSSLYVVAFLVLRHLRLGRAVVDQILRRVLVAIVVAAIVGIFEAVFSSTWNHLAVDDLGVTMYRHVVLGQQPGGLFSLHDVRTYGTVNGHEILRIGSVLFDYVGMGFAFAIGLGIAAELAARGRGRPWAHLSMPVLGIALLLTQTRSAFVAAVIAVLFALRSRAGKPSVQRARFARILAVAIVVTVPIVAATGALHRFSGDKGSNALHQSRAQAALSIMVHQPLGRGLGTTSGGVAAADQSLTANSPKVIATESQYLLVGTQLGVVGAGLYVAIVLLALRRVLRRRPDDAKSLAPSAMSNVAVGVAVGAAVTQPFVTIEVAFMFWGLLGLAVSVADQDSDRAPRGEPARHRGAATMRPVSAT